MEKDRNYGMELFSLCMQLGWYGPEETTRPMPVYLEGVPGTGKTQIVKAFGKEAAKYLKAQGISDTFHTAVLSLPQTGAETIEGIPAPDLEKGVMIRYPLADIRALKHARFGIFAGDEATSCLPATGAAAMTFVQDGIAGDERISNRCARVLMYNPTDCAAAGREFSPPEINRGVVIKWKPNSHDFLDFLMGGKGLMAHCRWLEPDWEDKFGVRARTFVHMYLSAHPKHINELQERAIDEDAAAEPWASQRQWYNFARILAAILSLGEEITSKLVLYALEGTVGPRISSSFIGFARTLDLPASADLIEAALQKRDAKGNLDPKDTRDKRKKRARDLIPASVYRRNDKLSTCLEMVVAEANAQSQRGNDDKWREYWDAAWCVIEPVYTGEFDDDEKQLDTVLVASRKLANNAPPGANYPPILGDLVKAYRHADRGRKAS